jgi:hypothetical protein
MYQESIENSDAFWSKKAKEFLDWEPKTAQLLKSHPALHYVPCSVADYISLEN